MPSIPYVISGIARKGPYEGYSLTSAIVGSGGGDTINIYVSDGTDLAASQLITLTHVSSGETISDTTNSSGQYTINLAVLNYSVGDEITIVLDTRTTNTELQQYTHLGADARKVILVDKLGNTYDERYPMQINPGEQLISHAFVKGNVSTTWTTTRVDARPETETVTFPNGTSYKMTFGYSTIGTRSYISSRSRWEKQ